MVGRACFQTKADYTKHMHVTCLSPMVATALRSTITKGEGPPALLPPPTQHAAQELEDLKGPYQGAQEGSILIRYCLLCPNLTLL